MSYLENFHHQISGRADSDPPAEKLVFLHGTMGFSANWRRIIKAFEDRFQILVYDQRGHGRSFQPSAGYSAKDYAADLEKILAELGWPQINLIGHSMGGRVAFEFASQQAASVTRLVIEDIGPSIGPTGTNLIVRILDAVPVPFADKRAAKQFFDGPFLELFKDERHKEGLAQYLYANITENEQKQAVWRFFEPGIRESVAQGHIANIWPLIEGLKIPTLLLRGESSKDLPPDLFNEMLQRNPMIHGVEIKDSGHWIHSDQPESFIRALNEFLSVPLMMQE